MSFKFRLSMELTALSIVNTCISKMTDSNIDEALTKEEGLVFDIPDKEALDNNLSNGILAVIMLHCYYESFLNSYLRDYLDYDPEGSVIRGGETEKLEIIFKGQEDELSRIKTTANWRDAHRIIHLRNYLIHFKNNAQEGYSSYPDIQNWKIGKEILGEIFTKSELEKCSNAVKQLVSDIAKIKGYNVLPESYPTISDTPYITTLSIRSDFNGT